MRNLILEHEWESERELMDVTPCCPKCGSAHIEACNLARRFGGAIGAIAGTTSGAALAMAGAEAGLVAGPLGAILGGVAGVVIEGIVGGAAGCAAGSKLGGAIDRNILHNRQCGACGHRFSDKS
jgi:hypothetical protein